MRKIRFVMVNPSMRQSPASLKTMCSILHTYPTSFVLLSKQVKALMTLTSNGQSEASINLLTYGSRCIASPLITYLRASTSVLVNQKVLSDFRCTSASP